MTQWYLEISTKKSILQKIKVEPCMKLHCFRCHDTNPPFGLKEVYAVNVNIGTLLKVFGGHSQLWWECRNKVNLQCRCEKLPFWSEDEKRHLPGMAEKKMTTKKNIQKNQESIYQMMSNLEIHGFKLQFGATTILWEDVSVQSFMWSREGPPHSWSTGCFMVCRDAANPGSRPKCPSVT